VPPFAKSSSPLIAKIWLGCKWLKAFRCQALSRLRAQRIPIHLACEVHHDREHGKQYNCDHVLLNARYGVMCGSCKVEFGVDSGEADVGNRLAEIGLPLPVRIPVSSSFLTLSMSVTLVNVASGGGSISGVLKILAGALPSRSNAIVNCSLPMCSVLT
jgi:hypothetical protein